MKLVKRQNNNKRGNNNNNFLLHLFSFQSEKDTAEARFTKLKLQAKAKMVALNKQIHELKGQTGPAVSDWSSCE